MTSRSSLPNSQCEPQGFDFEKETKAGMFLEQQELQAEVLTVAVGVGVVPRAALLTPWPCKLSSAETIPSRVAASRQRPDSTAAAHCNTQKPPCPELGPGHSSGQNGLSLAFSHRH